MSELGEEQVQRGFFKEYIGLVCQDASGVVIDSTGLPNQINMSVTDWGYHNGGIESENNLTMLFDSKISFLIRMPSNRTVYKNIVAENSDIY